jgi:hypothetical protein
MIISNGNGAVIYSIEKGSTGDLIARSGNIVHQHLGQEILVGG